MVSPFGIASIAYKNVQVKMWKFAYTNIVLHTRELVDEGYESSALEW